ncbi:quinone-dependent dihydroorotate dehydrogenase [Halovulum dunhuangense]|uniref:Dihydroorotate dehydrogenase (quinone) n=1 Tax=Halovulum dunhuangense TaxID=1505036 RepID=A0A849L4R4_9RHOB|nr:quinone-dependent dihydroorotate dehydrogenase [Halovulum dunhuangense]NNU81184.1 quinone-dependent dihydroorotate dehydrogenase [Halovulum dunhuangense]
MAALRRMDPERAHGLALLALRTGLAPLPRVPVYPRLETECAGLRLKNPLGLAAGFDKNAEAIGPLLAAGFGFVEVGAVTPRAQPGNPRPRLFRLTRDRAVINRFGFNNEGMEVVADRLAARPRGGVLGLNLGANKDSTDKAADFAAVLARCGSHVDFATVNVSSPNTEKLRDLQGPEALRAVLVRVQEANAGLPRQVPLFVKIAPDLEPEDLDAIARVAEETGLAGIVATNTTLARPAHLRSRHAAEAGGLSGAPLKTRATEVMRLLAMRTRLPLIGVGGIATGADAIERMRAGASAVQLYSALVYGGLGLVPRILADMDAALSSAGVGHVAEIVPQAGAAARSSAG